ncbi:RNA-binding domain-containing protein [Streptomyces sp. NPDC014748]|uniref:RNA-binding domain-containing protein n=1 Tax=Streptomyces sp. NPDC014748 TaxID=3364905 RepID=UPI0036F4CB93
MVPLDAADSALASIGDGWDADRSEHGALDFKETPDTSGDTGKNARKKFHELLAETAVCFANSEGGAIVIGVKDRAPDRASALPGVPSKYTPEELVDAIFERTSPAITCRPVVREVDGVRIIVLLVPKGSGVHSTSLGVYKIRLNDRCVPLGGDQLRGLRALREHYDWSAQPSGVGIEGLSRAALERAASLLFRSGYDDLARLAENDPTAFCKSTRLLSGDKVTRAAVLLYGNPGALRSEIAEWGVNVQSRETPGSDPQILLRRDSIDVPLIFLLDQVIALVVALSRTQTIRVGAEQVELVDYPPDALREIFANAFAHRDWEAPGVVEIVHSPDELVTTSPGGLLPTLRIDRLLHDAAAPRNRLLAENMARLRLAEMSGLGLDRAFREIARLGKEPPILNDGPRFRVVLPGGRGDEAFARYINGPNFPRELSGDLDVLMILTALRHAKSVSAHSLNSRLQRSPLDVQRVLRRMQEAGIIQATKGTIRRQHPNYTLASEAIAGMRAAISYRVSSIDNDDQKLIRHLKRHGRITNEDVRNYLDCDIPTARNRLTRLRNRGLIDFAPDSPRRGSAVVYVKTEKLDASEGAAGRPGKKSDSGRDSRTSRGKSGQMTFDDFD